MKKEIKDFKESNKGFSLVELIVAVSVLVLVSIPFALAFITATKVNGAARNKERANTAATTEMEYLRATDFSTLTFEADRASGAGASVTLSNNNSTTSPNITGTLRSNKEEVDGMNSYVYTRNVEIDGKPFFIQATMNPFSESGASVTPSSDETAFYNLSGANAFPIIQTSTDVSNSNTASFTYTDENNLEMASKLADFYFSEAKNQQLYQVGSGSSAKTYRRNGETDNILNDMQRNFIFTIHNEPVGADSFRTQVYVNATFTYRKDKKKTYPVDLGYKCIYSSLWTRNSGSVADENSNLENIYFNFNGNVLSTNRNDPIDNVYIINDKDNPVKVGFRIKEQTIPRDSNNYYIGIYAANSAKQADLSSINLVNVNNNPALKTKVFVASNFNKVCYYSTNAIDSEPPIDLKGFRNVINTGKGNINASSLMNLSPLTGETIVTKRYSPIYVVHMEVFSGDTADANKMLIELDSTVQ